MTKTSLTVYQQQWSKFNENIFLEIKFAMQLSWKYCRLQKELKESPSFKVLCRQAPTSNCLKTKTSVPKKITSANNRGRKSSISHAGEVLLDGSILGIN